jgi:prepilin signal peptidase PulO-like enzyme (type II secretory pathway)
VSDIELAIVLIWLTAMGGTIGSFLNVVVYRLPAGMSLSQPGSHCPVCGHAIRWYDNVPVFGWLMLRGHCRDCGTWISMRYPLVEAVTAMVFLAVGAVVLVARGANLPLRPVPVDEGTIVVIWTGIRLAGILAYHLMLLATLLPMALIEYDGKPIPWRLVLPALVVGLVAPMLWPYLHPVPSGPIQVGWPAGLIDGIAGLGLGIAIGLGVEHLPFARPGRGVAAGPACVGLMLGWQAGVAIAGAALILYGITQGLGRVIPGLRRLPFTGWLLVASLVWILAWRPLIEVL